MEDNLLADLIPKRLESVKSQFFRLLWIAGPTARGQNRILTRVSRQIDAPLLNVNLAVSRRLLELSEKQRPLKVSRILESAITDQSGHTVILKNIELLFDAALKVDPFRLLQKISRNITLIVGWNGIIEDSHLVYAAPGHPDYRKCPVKELNVFSFQASTW
jgi:hypothetical protein